MRRRAALSRLLERLSSDTSRWAELWEFLNLLQETKPMAKVADYYSINEAKKPKDKQVYHDNDQCIAGRDIPQNERRPGRGGYRHCNDCDK